MKTFKCYYCLILLRLTCYISFSGNTGLSFRVMATKRSTLGAQCFQRLLNCRVVLGTPFLKIFSKNLPDTDIMYHAFFPLRSPTFCHIFRVPCGVRDPSVVVIRQRVRAPGRSSCIIIWQKLWEPDRSPIDHPTFTSGHRLVPTPANIRPIPRVAGEYHPLKMGT